MQNSLGIISFFLFMTILVFKKPISELIGRIKPPLNEKQLENQMRSFETVLHAMAKDLGEIKQLLREQNASTDLLQLKNDLKEIDSDSDDNESVDVQETDSDSNSTRTANDSPTNFAPGQNDGDSDREPVDVLFQDDRNDLGEVVDQHTIRFERILPAHVDQVWNHISNYELLDRWIASPSKMSPRVGGRVEFNLPQDRGADLLGCARIRGLVSDFSPQNRLSFSWLDSTNSFDSEVTFELDKHGDNESKLTVTHSRLPANKLAEYLSAWHVWLENLICRLRNAIPLDFASTTKKLVRVYSAIVLASVIAGAPAAEAHLNAHDYQAVRAERNHLLDKFDAHWHDAEALEREISDLKRENSSSNDSRLDQLSRKLDDQHRDMRKLELDIRDLDKALI